MKVGDKVRYSAPFLRSTGQMTGDTGFARGQITGIQRLGTDPNGTELAVIAWDNPDIPTKVNVKNLEIDPTRRG